MTQRVRRVAILIIGIIHGGMPWLFGKSVFSSKSQQVQNLETAFAMIEQYRITDYRNQDWCKNIAYAGGQFSDTAHPATCNLFAGPAPSFTPPATAISNSITQVLHQSGVRIAFFDADFNAAGRIRSARFDINCFLCGRLRYEYQPNYGAVPEDIPYEMWFTPINHNWYKVNGDWN
ncbi:hypothetical protein [Leptolyngbya sp. FACHB-17]|uniref:hypothetical protein n=1 Tax=unclassified Leptolyngbya TaxID=2650499 RepID=UPI0016809865|nr:hypothetical protein [Leptolyngbya sp. FACHB-17]MBD2079502.1 hypothetical protein [Leptolyngbya sp. FACHB-17]